MSPSRLDSPDESPRGGSKLDKRTVPPLGWTGPQFLDIAKSAADDVERYYASVDERPVRSSVAPGYLRKLLPTEAPLYGEDWEDIRKDIESKIMPGMTHWQSPRFMAYFAASSTYPGIMGEFWSAALTAPAFNWICSPAITELETIVTDWLGKAMGLASEFLSDSEGGGVIQGSICEAVVAVMAAARERFVRIQLERAGIKEDGSEEAEDQRHAISSRLVALGSGQSHSSTNRGAMITGTRFRSISVKREDDYAMTGEGLRREIERLIARGLMPYYLTVTIGTTNTCAVDDLASIAEVAKDYPDIWIHCDAAHAGAALILPELHYLTRQLSFVDSFSMNAHKWLLVNLDASCLYVRSRRDLTEALSISPPYLRNEFSDKGLVTDYRDWQISMSRRFRALKFWFVLRTWGITGLQEHIRHHFALAKLFGDLIRSRPDLFDFVATPAFALTVITVRSAEPTQTGSEAVGAGNRVTEAVCQRIKERNDFFLTSTVIQDVVGIRIAAVNPLAEETYIRELFEQLADAAEEVRALA